MEAASAPLTLPGARQTGGHTGVTGWDLGKRGSGQEVTQSPQGALHYAKKLRDTGTLGTRGDTLGTHWDMRGHAGTHEGTLGHAGDMLEHMGTHWDTLGHAGTWWDMQGHAGDTLGHVGTCWDMLGTHWDTLGHVWRRGRAPWRTGPQVPLLRRGAQALGEGGEDESETVTS